MTVKSSAAIAAFLITLFTNSVFSQDFSWTSIAEQTAKSTPFEVAIEAEKASYFNLDYTASRSEFSNSFTMEIPMAGGTFSTFLLEENNTMTAGLKQKFPNIKSYDAIATDSSGYLGKVDFTSKGFHAMLFHPVENTQFVDPLYQTENSTHIAYMKKDFRTDKEMNCQTEFDLKGDGLGDPKSGANYNTCVLRTYRIAIAATGEFTIFHGGSVAEALAAQVTTMNRVNGIYERDFGVTMTIVADNDEVIYTNPNSDPYSNGDVFAMLNENPPVINSEIGFSNYDIGHVFGTNSGGVAGFGVTCDSGKARGVTGNNAPIGDPFDVDYVAHEIGHQFGGSHTFNNSCNGNRSNSTAVEPGSGSTIMAYAGICNPNVQNNSDDHFHGVSMRQIGQRINSDNCPVIAGLDNLAPVLEGVVTDFFVPSSTPFALTAFAFDPDEGDVLTYNFEQIDNEISEQPPLANATNGPNFRSFSPTINPTQYFPRLETLISGSSDDIWQVLPSVTRTMTFRCTVKDNAEGGGCAQFEDLDFTVVENAGPFTVTQPNVQGITWQAFENEAIFWDVANTDLSPINAAMVDIRLSIDGGLTYPITLAEDVPNTGQATIVVPNEATSAARVMVMNAGGTFFDISNNNFTIEGLVNGYFIVSDDTSQAACVGESIEYNLSILGVGDFDEIVTLSLSGDLADVDASFSESILMIGESTVLTIEGTVDVAPGILEIIVEGSAESFNQTLALEAGFNSIDASVPILVAPDNGAEFVSTETTLDWESLESPDALYTIQISTDPTFETDLIILESEVLSEITIVDLLANSTYFWRVMKETTCSIGDFSEAYSFGTHSCFPFLSEDVPLQIPPSSGVFTSVIDIPYEGVVQDINVTNIQGSHGNVGQIKMALISPSGTEVVLIDEICDGSENFDFGFDDSSQLITVDCPATSGISYRPNEELSAFIGDQSQGMWTLEVTDETTGGGGSVEEWSIEICVATSGSFELSSDVDVLQLCQGESTIFELNCEQVFAFEDFINLSAPNTPPGITVEFSPTSIFVGQSSNVTVSIAEDFDVSAFQLGFQGVSGEVTDLLELLTEINSEALETTDLLMPEPAAIVTSLAEFEWGSIPSPSATYNLQISADIDFDNIVQSYSNLEETSQLAEDLPPSETLFWRVLADNGCNNSTSLVSSFTTLACQVSEANQGLPLTISPIAGEVTSELEIDEEGVIESISVTRLEGNHFRVSDLTVSLESPAGTEILLFSNICEGNEDFDFGFADGGILAIECPATTGNIYSPFEPLSLFEGESAEGIWTLKIVDDESGASGSLSAWSVEICYDEDFSTGNSLTPEIAIYPNPTEDLLTIYSRDGVEIEALSLRDISGRLVYQESGRNETQKILDLSQFAKGAYLLDIQGSFGRIIEKVIKK